MQDGEVNAICRINYCSVHDGRCSGWLGEMTGDAQAGMAILAERHVLEVAF
jgi:hypothetical protein